MKLPYLVRSMGNGNTTVNASRRPSAIFLANSYHLNVTGSSLFFIDLLRLKYDVSVVPHKLAWDHIEDKKWDLLVSWQHLYSVRELEAFGVPNTVLVPMWDDCPHEAHRWTPYASFKFLAFCDALYSTLGETGVSCFRCRYYPPLPDKSLNNSHEPKALLWTRNSAVDFIEARKVLDVMNVRNVHLHGVSAENEASLRDSFNDFRITTSEWFPTKNEYEECLASCSVFVAPRTSEGIGMSFLESMAMGQCVIAHDAPTMNEYIEHGKTGILLGRKFAGEGFDPIEIGTAARKSCIEGRACWEASVPEILDFLAKPSSPRRSRTILKFRKRLFSGVRAILRKVKNILKKG